MKDLSRQLEQRRQDKLYRERRVLDSPQGVEITIDGKPLSITL